MKKAMLLVLCLNFVYTASAQLEKILHQTFELNDSVASVSLNLYGEYELEKWSSNTIMIVTEIELYDASPSILNHFVKKGRYEVAATANGANFELASNDLERKAIKTRIKKKDHWNKETVETKECYEIIKVRIFVPEDFLVVNKTMLNRIITAEETTATSN